MNGTPFSVSLSTGSLYNLSLRTTFSLAKDLGLDGVELAIGPECAMRGPREVRVMARRHGVRILSLHPPILPLPGWIRLTEVVAALARWAGELGVAVVTLHTPKTESLASESGQRYALAVEQLACELRRIGSTLALENRARFSSKEAVQCLDAPDDLLRFARAHGTGVTFDTAHAGTLFGDILPAYHVLSADIVNIHFSDLVSGRSFLGQHWSDTVLRHHQIPGRGVLPLAVLIQGLCQQKYAGLLTLECSPVALRSWSSCQRRIRLAEGLDFILTHAAPLCPSPLH